MPDFNEFSLDLFELCLSLLVKIEDDKTELILTFLDRFKFLINKKFDEVFSMREGIQEIDFSTYIKIYDNYEFAINENEFTFYETQIVNDTGIQTGINVGTTNEKNLNIRNLSSKFFKKGTFIWICKKIHENILTHFIILTYKLFNNLFDKKFSANLNILYNQVIDTFNKKIKDLLEKSGTSLDSIFFKEGLISFYITFYEVLLKINDEKITNSFLQEKIINNNKFLAQIFLSNQQSIFTQKICENIKSSIILINSKIFDKQIILSECNALHAKVTNMMIEYLQMLKKLELGDLLDLNNDDSTKYYYKNILSLVNVYFFIMKSSNILKFPNMKFKNLENEDLHGLRSLIEKCFDNSNSKEQIYIKIILCKLSNTPQGLKSLNDKFLREFPNIKNNKFMTNELRSFLDKELNETLIYLYDSLVQHMDLIITSKLKQFFYLNDWLNCKEAITFRIEVRDLCYELLNFKNQLFELLEEEKRSYQENKSSTFNEALLNKKQRKLTKFQKEMECLHIRRLAIYEGNAESPQLIMMTIAKIFFKNICEYVKMIRFSKQGFQQIQLDMNLIKYFFREYLIVDLENVLDGFFLEIMKTCSFNTVNPEPFDETVILY